MRATSLPMLQRPAVSGSWCQNARGSRPGPVSACSASISHYIASRGGRRGRLLRKAEASDVPRRLAAAAAALVAADAVLRREDRYAPTGPTVWPPKAFKETQRTELVPGMIWGLEQVIAFFTVSANIRMIAVRLEDGKLWVCGPISPTRFLAECAAHRTPGIRGLSISSQDQSESFHYWGSL